MSKLTLTNLVNLENQSTAVNAINSNNDTIKAGFDNTLSLDGTAPNQMQSSLDMNSNQVLNLPSPTSNFSPLRVIDRTTLNGGGSISVSNLPAGGSTHQVLTKNTGTSFDVNWQYPVSTGGLANQVLTKNTSSDLDASWKYPVPVGGTTNQVLTKVSNLDFDLTWSNSTSKSYVSASGTTRTAQATDNGKIVLRSNSGANMQDNMPASGAAGVYQYTNADPSGIYAVTASGGATIDGIASNYILLGPGQTVIFNMDSSGTNYRTVSYPLRAKLAAGSTGTIYVQATGSDLNPGVLSSAPKSTRQAIYDEMYHRYDLNAAQMVIQHTGNFTDTGVVLRGRPPGLGNSGATVPYAHTVLFKGDTTTPGNCIINSTGNCFQAINTATFHIDGFKMIATASGVDVSFGAIVGIGNVEYGACTSYHVNTSFCGVVHFDNNYTISGAAGSHMNAASGSAIQNQGGAITATLTGTPAFSGGFWNVSSNGLIVGTGMSFSGAATGPRFNVGPYGGAFNINLGTDPNTLLPGNSNGTYTSVFNNANGASPVISSPILSGTVNVSGLAATGFVTTDVSKNLSTFPTANSGVLVTSGGGVPSISTTLPNVAHGTPTSITLTNGTGLPTTGLTGILQAAQEPAHTGDMTNSSGSLATTVTGINGVNQNAAWTAYTPTITSQTGTITTSSATGRYRLIGKTVILQVDVTITTAGTGAGGLRASLPFTAAAFNYCGSCKAIAISGKSGSCQIGVSGTVLDMRDSTGTTMIASGEEVVATITYEVP